MKCYRCNAESDDLPLAGLHPYERTLYTLANVVMRVCQNCGLEQSHVGDGEPLDAQEAAGRAPGPANQGT